MANGGSTIRLGPFNGGLNNIAYGSGAQLSNTQNAIADNELLVCTDFDFLPDGTLATRTPVGIEPLTGNAAIDNIYMKLVGFFAIPTSSISYTIIEVGGNLYYRTGNTDLVGDTIAWTLIGNVGDAATAGIQYAGQFYIVLASTPGFRWSPSGGLVAVPSLPAGKAIQLFKERLWLVGNTTIASGSRLFYSNIGTGSTWTTGVDFVDIEADNGQNLTDLFAGPSALYLFKENSTYVLTFDSLPSRGNIQVISASIGANIAGCYCSYEDSIYVLHGASVYRLQGYSYTRINTKVSVLDTNPGSLPRVKYSLSTVGDRIVVQYNNAYFVYYPVTNNWTEWELADVTPYKWSLVPTSLASLGYKLYLAPGNNAAFTEGRVYVIGDRRFPNIFSETPTPTPKLLTKLHSFDSPETFKRLHWWGIDTTAHQNETCTLTLKAISVQGAVATKAYTVAPANSEEVFYKGPASSRFTKIQFGLDIGLGPNYYQISSMVVSSIVASISSKQSPTSISPTLN